MNLPIDSIIIPTVRRPLDPDTVDRIARSIGEIGLLSPILVRESAKGHILVAGLHRLEAIRQLGHVEIACDVVECDDVRARLLEISENLDRHDLTVAERSQHIAEWVRLTTATSRGRKNAPPGGAQPHEKGIKAAVRDLGLERTDVQRAIKIDAITPEAKAAAKEADLDDNQSALLKVASEPPSRQVGAVNQLAAARQQSRRGRSDRAARGDRSKRALAELVGLLMKRREDALEAHEHLTMMLPAQLAALKDSLAKALFPTEPPIGYAPSPAVKQIFKSKDAAIADAHGELGTGARRGHDFVVKKTARGEWFWRAVTSQDIGQGGSILTTGARSGGSGASAAVLESSTAIRNAGESSAQ
jgi:ParB family chromosome partitioning protein